MEALAEIFRTIGPTAAIAVVFVWQAVARERRMSCRLDHLEDFINKEMLKAIAENTTAMHAVATAMQKCQR